ncbi:MAG: Unknown protein [uncultured Sulfurovum sp.]|uniref:Uncharacterized protein n=1 Tax=uncultured Sulfurovum sp. TaxID=269237 RepID=A0A6S6SXH5_9BACT|nr:MAG: Unknown protein [uncultured Sulfurovum sp.]
MSKKRIAAAIDKNSEAYAIWELIEHGMKPKVLTLLLSRLYELSKEGGYEYMIFDPVVLSELKSGKSAVDILESLNESTSKKDKKTKKIVEKPDDLRSEDEGKKKGTTSIKDFLKRD